MKKVVISGGPSTGKSTIFEALKTEYPYADFVPEAAEQVIASELSKQAAEPTYEPALPVTNYYRFAPLVIARQIENESKIHDSAKLVFLDRCIIDNIGYLAYNGITDYAEDVIKYSKTAGYTIALFCDWLGKFEQTAIRHETAEQGYAVHRHLVDAYGSAGLPIVQLPAVSVEERLGIIRSTVDSL